MSRRRGVAPARVLLDTNVVSEARRPTPDLAVVRDFANAGEGDLLDISAFGVTSATFAADVDIQAHVAGTTVTVGGSEIVLLGTDPATVVESNFLLAP